jgi:hypothetical protein
VGSSHLADDLSAVTALPADPGLARTPLVALMRVLAPVPDFQEFVHRIDEFDIQGAVRDLTTDACAEFLLEHADVIDALGVPIFHVTGSTTVF